MSHGELRLRRVERAVPREKGARHPTEQIDMRMSRKCTVIPRDSHVKPDGDANDQPNNSGFEEQLCNLRHVGVPLADPGRPPEYTPGAGGFAGRHAGASAAALKALPVHPWSTPERPLP
jgi:hypothetical protein